MSMPANREILIQFLDALRQQDLDTVLQVLAEDVTWHELDLEGMAVVRQGHQQVRQSLQQALQIFEPGEITREIFLEGDRAVVVRQGSPRSRLTGETLEIHMAHVISFSKGQIIGVRSLYGPELVTLMRM